TGGQIEFLIGVIGANTDSDPADDTGWSKIRAAQMEWAATRAGAGDHTMVSHHSLDLSHADGLHYDNAGYVEMGRRFARSLAYALGFSTHSAEGPKIAAASISGDTVTVTFDLNGSSAL